jgi:hypothetical protein
LSPVPPSARAHRQHRRRSAYTILHQKFSAKKEE